MATITVTQSNGDEVGGYRMIDGVELFGFSIDLSQLAPA